MYLHGFEPREAYELTGSRLKPKNQHLEFYVFSFQPLVVLILSIRKGMTGTDKNPTLRYK